MKPDACGASRNARRCRANVFAISTGVHDEPQPEYLPNSARLPTLADAHRAASPWLMLIERSD
jgi:hypothetical protein